MAPELSSGRRSVVESAGGTGKTSGGGEGGGLMGYGKYSSSDQVTPAHHEALQ